MKDMRKIFNIHVARISLVALLGVSLTSCNDFLDERPSKTSSLVVTTTDQLQALLDNYNTFYQEGNRTSVYSTDDYEFNMEIYDARPSTFSMAAVEFSLWDTEYLPDDGREGYWSSEYKKIFTANMVLENLDKVSGPEAEKIELKAEAHFIRAYSYWNLANTYCLPYTESNKGEMGLPIRTGTSFEQPAARASLEETYSLIENDLAEALKINVALMKNGKPKHWRANIAGVHGFAARYYLNANNYAKALEHANAALSEYNTLVNYNTDMRYGKDVSVPINTGQADAKTVVLKFPYTHDNQSDMTDMLGWKEFLYFRVLNHESWWYIPSQELLELYDKENDLRYTYHVVEGYSYDRGMVNPAYDYPGYIFFFKDRLPSGPTVAEMYLIKAECEARTNDYATAMTTLNTLRKSRYKEGAAYELSAANQNEAVSHILEERRREMPFTRRWTDLRRLNNNEDSSDDVEVTRTFYPYNFSSVLSNEQPKEYKLEKNSRRYAAPIPRPDITSSQGEIEQNTY